MRFNQQLCLLVCTGSHTVKCFIYVLPCLCTCLKIILDTQLTAQIFSVLPGNSSIIQIVELRASEDNIINCCYGTFFFEHFNVLFNAFKALFICQIEGNDAALAISEVISGQAKVRILPLGVPNLKPHGRILDLQWQTFQVNSDGVNLILRKILVDKSNQERCLSWRGLAEHNKLILSSVASHRVNFSLIVRSRWEPLGRGSHAVWGAL